MRDEFKQQSTASAIALLAKQGKLPDRDALISQFLNGHHLTAGHNWLFHCLHFTGTSFRYLLGQKGVREDPFERTILRYFQRMENLLGALSMLMVKNEDNSDSPFTICVEGYYPIHKSIFELLVEVQLAFAYKKEFSKDPNWKESLEKRIQDWAALNKAQREHTARIRLDFSKLNIPKENLSQEALEFAEKQASEARDKRLRIAEEGFLTNRFSSIGHWFPTATPGGKPYNPKAKHGSMQWRCIDVLCSVFPEAKDFWNTAYFAFYERLNRLSHPHLGYEFDGLEQSERLFEVGGIQYMQAINLKSQFLDHIIEHFSLPVDLNPECRIDLQEMRKIETTFLKDGMTLTWAAEMA